MALSQPAFLPYKLILMKKPILLLIALMISTPLFATTLHAPVKITSCDPGSCFTEIGSHYDLTQGIAGYDRQVKRVMKQVDEIGSANSVDLSARTR